MNCKGCHALTETYTCKLRHAIKRVHEHINGCTLQRIYTLEECPKPMTEADYITAHDAMKAEEIEGAGE